MIRRSLLAVAVFLLPTLVHAQAKLLRYPTYSKGKVAFSYLGDIWTANENGTGAQRLTDHEARDIYPRFSPDGNTIAFSSARAGNNDVYVIPAAGGKPRQLTYHSADDIVVGWTPDGKKIIFWSTRDKGVFPSIATLFEVPVDGGLEMPIKTDWGSWASYSPDSTKLAFTRHPGVWSRQHYRGSFAVDLWLMDVAAKKFTRLGNEDYKGNYLWPMYGTGGEIYYVADELPNEKTIKFAGPEVMKSVNNIWKISEKGGKATQITHHTSGNLFFPSMSADGKTIVYEENFGLWKLDVSSGKSTEIRIDIKSDTKDNDVHLISLANEADSFHLSPSTKRAAISSHGEVFSIATDRGEVQRVTESPWRDQEPRWSPDGKWIAFLSDRSGREEVWIADELGKGLKKLTDADSEKSAPVWSPDSKSMLWWGSDHKVRMLNMETGVSEVVASNDKGDIGSAEFSPDGKWISYDKEDAMARSHLFVKELGGGPERMITGEGFLISGSAKWTPDGKKLVFIGGIGAPAMASLNRSTYQLYSVALTPDDKGPEDRDINTEAQATAGDTPGRGGAGGGRGGGGAGRGGAGGGRGGAASIGPEVKIDWDGLDHRVQPVGRLTGNVSSVNPSPDSRTYALVMGGGPDGSGVYTIGEDGTRLTRMQVQAAGGGGGGGGGFGGGGGGSGEPQWSRDSRSLFFLQRGSLYTVNVPATPAGGGGAGDTAAAAAGGGGRGGGGGAAAAGPTARRIPFTVRLQIDEAAERKQVFEEAWRTMKYRYYDADMHGVNWAAAKDTYETLLSDVADVDELHTVIMMMIGKLNSSHTGISGGGLPGQPPPERVQTRYPGFEMEPDAAGYYKVSHVFHTGPADHDYVKLHVSDYILTVNGKDLKSGDNYWQYFNALPGRKFEFTVNSKPELDGAWNLSLDPVNQNAQDNLAYERWVADRQTMVGKISNFQIGYLHIREMNQAGLQKFQRDLLENQDKKAIIIDERFNGGGGIDQELLEILNQRTRYQTVRGRDSVDLPRPIQAYFGPMVVLQNERSASDAEMFPEGFRALGLGKVIGVPTYGAVIGTSDYGLLDGSRIRTPAVGVFGQKGQDLENYGVPPDVLVDNTPPDFLEKRDRQIERAIEVLQADMKK